MLEDLIFNSKVEKEIDINGQKIVIKLLDNNEMLEILKVIGKCSDDNSRLFSLMLEVVSKAIIKVNDVFVNYEDNRKTISKVHEKVLMYIYKQYGDFKEEIDKAIEDGIELKN